MKLKFWIGAAAFLIILSLWYAVIIPKFENIPNDFYYEANINSEDSFFDENLEDFKEPISSKTVFIYEAISHENQIILIKNTFDVQKPSGERIFLVERAYAIDKYTNKHVPGYGDKDREGYLFAPKNLDNNREYTYWHINYDNIANMKFQNEEVIHGLVVYRYLTNYHSDQTVNLAHLPGVPKERGVELDIELQLWIEPVTSRLIKYEDYTTAYYYNITSGKRLHPWNKFHNEYSSDSIIKQIVITQNERFKLFILKIIFPFLILICYLVLNYIMYLRVKI